jgi:hypothetical protein
MGETDMIDFTDAVPLGYSWLNPPTSVQYVPGKAGAVGGYIEITTDPETDFWQRTHYGFRRDNGHCLLRDAVGDFSFTARFEFQTVNRYDQCGLMIRHDTENWIKSSIECENDRIARLGSVATNMGFSDWATTDIPATVTAMTYRASRKANDILLESAEDGQPFKQMRITHVYAAPEKLRVGVYAASPLSGSFTCRVTTMKMESNRYFHEE